VDAGGGVQSQRGSIVEKILLSVQKFCKLHFFAITFPKLNATWWNLVNLHFRTCAKLQKINQYDQISIYVVCRRVVMQIWKHWAVLGCGGFRAKARNSGQSQYSHVPNGQICIRSAPQFQQGFCSLYTRPVQNEVDVGKLTGPDIVPWLGSSEVHWYHFHRNRTVWSRAQGPQSLNGIIHWWRHQMRPYTGSGESFDVCFNLPCFLKLQT